jgi:hypothetical protein
MTPRAGSPTSSLEVALKHPRCPFCLDVVQHDDAKVGCVGCMAWLHEACVREHGACSACGRALLAGRAPSATARRPARPGADEDVSGLIGALVHLIVLTVGGVFVFAVFVGTCLVLIFVE